MRTIAVVEKNRCHFDRMEEFALPLLYQEHNPGDRAKIKKNLNDYIWSVIEPFIQFVDIDDDDDFITVACNNVTKCFPERKPDNFFYHTEGSYSSPKKFIEFIYCQPTWKGYEDSKTENMNTLACLFSLKHNVIENNCIIFANKYDLSAPHFTKIDSISKEDILAVIRRRYFCTASLIKENTIVKYYYQNPQYLITKVFGLTEKDNIQKLSLSHLKYNLVFYFQHDKSKYVNQIATRINGSYQMHGDILVLHEMEENIFTNISTHEIKRLNVLSYGRLYDRQLKNEEIHTVPTIEVDKDGKEIQKKTTPLWSRYIVINKRMDKWQQTKNKCINCEKEMANPITCQRCYRAKYCSIKCQEEFKDYHYDECINPNVKT